jgi:AcrR family transcriptional regulator
MTKKTWKQDPKSVQNNILKIAIQEFITNGFSGTSVNEIAKQSDTSKRMIYYYFTNKEGLYKAVLESTYQSIRDAESNIKYDLQNPICAMQDLIKFTFWHHKNNPHFIKLIMIENIQDAKYLNQSKIIKELNIPAIKRIEDIYQAGVEKKTFKKGLDSLEIHWQISALSFFNISNQNSFTSAFGDSLFEDDKQNEILKNIQAMILGFIKQ